MSQALLETTGAGDDCSLEGAFDRQIRRYRIGRLNTILFRGGGNLNDPYFKVQMSGVFPGEGQGGNVEVSS